MELELGRFFVSTWTDFFPDTSLGRGRSSVGPDPWPPCLAPKCGADLDHDMDLKPVVWGCFGVTKKPGYSVGSSDEEETSSIVPPSIIEVDVLAPGKAISLYKQGLSTSRKAKEVHFRGDENVTAPTKVLKSAGGSGP